MYSLAPMASMMQMLWLPFFLRCMQGKNRMAYPSIFWGKTFSFVSLHLFVCVFGVHMIWWSSLSWFRKKEHSVKEFLYKKLLNLFLQFFLYRLASSHLIFWVLSFSELYGHHTHSRMNMVSYSGPKHSVDILSLH